MRPVSLVFLGEIVEYEPPARYTEVIQSQAARITRPVPILSRRSIKCVGDPRGRARIRVYAPVSTMRANLRVGKCHYLLGGPERVIVVH